MRPIWFIRILSWAAYIVATTAIIYALHEYFQPAMAEDRATWFKSLKQPLGGASCCDISDCRKTIAEWKNGGWRAQVWGFWRDVPYETVLRDKTSIDGEAYVCASNLPPVSSARIFCFVPPSPGS